MRFYLFIIWYSLNASASSVQTLCTETTNSLVAPTNKDALTRYWGGPLPKPIRQLIRWPHEVELAWKLETLLPAHGIRLTSEHIQELVHEHGWETKKPSWIGSRPGPEEFQKLASALSIASYSPPSRLPKIVKLVEQAELQKKIGTVSHRALADALVEDLARDGVKAHIVPQKHGAFWIAIDGVTEDGAKSKRAWLGRMSQALRNNYARDVIVGFDTDCFLSRHAPYFQEHPKVIALSPIDFVDPQLSTKGAHEIGHFKLAVERLNGKELPELMVKPSKIHGLSPGSNYQTIYSADEVTHTFRKQFRAETQIAGTLDKVDALNRQARPDDLYFEKAARFTRSDVAANKEWVLEPLQANLEKVLTQAVAPDAVERGFSQDENYYGLDVKIALPSGDEVWFRSSQLLTWAAVNMKSDKPIPLPDIAREVIRRSDQRVRGLKP